MPNELQGLLMPKKKGNALQELSQGVSKGFWADGLGGPVDLITTLANLGIAGAGYAGHKSGLLSQPIPLIEKPVGGSDWIAEKMRSAGILGDNPGSTADNYGRVLGGLLSPVVQAKAPQIASAANAAPAVAKAGAYALGEKGAQMIEGQMVKHGGILPATVWHGSRDPSWIDRGEAFFGGNPQNMPSKFMWVNPKRAVAENYAGTSEMARWKAENGLGPAPAPTAGVRKLDLSDDAKILKVKDVNKAAAELGTQWGGSSPLEDLLDAARSRGYDAVQMVMDGGNIAVLNSERLKPLKR